MCQILHRTFYAKNYSLFIWNANLTECPAFYFAKSGSHIFMAICHAIRSASIPPPSGINTLVFLWGTIALRAQAMMLDWGSPPSPSYTTILKVHGQVWIQCSFPLSSAVGSVLCMWPKPNQWEPPPCHLWESCRQIHFLPTKVAKLVRRQSGTTDGRLAT